MGTAGNDLLSVAQRAGFGPRLLSGETGELLVTQRGARVLGIFLEGASENLLWTNPKIFGEGAAPRAGQKNGDWNLGGDRVWLSPEIELHFLDPWNPSHEVYAVPPAIDPGHYEVKREGPTGIVFKTKGETRNLVSGQTLRFKIRRSVCLCSPPLAVEGLSYVGFELSSELRIKASEEAGGVYGLWHLMQIPPAGTVYIPTRRTPEMVDYFKTGVAGHVQQRMGYVSFPVTGTTQQKLGLRADQVRGTMGYYRPLGDERASLIVRQATVFPGATYADYPADARERRDIALQFYNDSGAAGGFGEMEYHSPAATADNFRFVRDVSRTWCFAGPAERVRQVGTELLGVPELT